MEENAETGMNFPNIKPDTLFTIGSYDVPVTLFVCVVVTLALIIFAVVVRVVCVPRWNKDFKSMSPLRAFMEWVVGMFSSNSNDLTGKYSSFVGPVYFGSAAFIMFGVLIELFGLRSPMSDLNCDLVLGFLTFFTVQILGIVQHRAKRLKHFAPVIPIVTDCVVPFSMALRLFGSVYSGCLIMDIIYDTAMKYVLPAFLSVIFTIFHAVIQSYVFMFLSMNFINEAIE